MNHLIFLETTGSSVAKLFGMSIIGTLALAGLVIVIQIAIIMAYLTFAAKKNSELFNYDKLAEKIAEQMMKKQIEYDKHKQRERIKRYKTKKDTVDQIQ